MNKIRFYIYVYSTAIFLSGIMAFWHSGKLLALPFEIIPATLIFTSLFFIKKRRLLTLRFLIFFTLIPLLYYGIIFVTTYDFIAAFFSIISVFFIAALITEIFRK